MDFYAVTDHAVFLGLLKESADTSTEFSKYELSKPMHDLNKTVSNSIFSILKRNGLFRAFGAELAAGVEDGSIDRDIIQNVGNSVWKKLLRQPMMHTNQEYLPHSLVMNLLQV